MFLTSLYVFFSIALANVNHDDTDDTDKLLDKLILKKLANVKNGNTDDTEYTYLMDKFLDKMISKTLANLKD